MPYDLCIWDPSRHGPLPTSREEGIQTTERLSALSDAANFAFTEFAGLLIQRYNGDPKAQQESSDMEAFWGCDPRHRAGACRSAVLRLSIPVDECIRQIAHAVDAAAELGLVVMDDETGMSFLPDGTILPPDDRDMWEFNLAEMQAGSPEPDATKTDGRTFLEKLGGELFDALGRGNRHQ